MAAKNKSPNINMTLTPLIVDDSSAIRKILQRALRQAISPVGEIYEASDGIEALSVLESQQISFVLSDINMPNMDGLQLLSEIKSRPQFKDLPVIMITTEGSQARVLEAIKLGAAGYVRKPFTPEQIKEKLVGIV